MSNPNINTETVISGVDYQTLATNIAAQYDLLSGASGLTAMAQSGLDYVVNIDAVLPEVDLLNPFYNMYNNVSSLNLVTNYNGVVTALNNHVINRGTTATTGSTNSTRLNLWISQNQPCCVPHTYATMSSGLGYIIDPLWICH